MGQYIPSGGRASTSIRCEMEAACGAGLQDQLRVYCATNRLNPVDEYPLERPVERVYFAPDTSTTAPVVQE